MLQLLIETVSMFSISYTQLRVMRQFQADVTKVNLASHHTRALSVC